jgi:hypothetical protein
MSSSYWTTSKPKSGKAAAEYSARWPRIDRCAAKAPPSEKRSTAHLQSGVRVASEDVSSQLSLLPLLLPPILEDEVQALRDKILPHIRASRRGRGAHLELTVTDNRSTMISVRRGPGSYRLRLHRMFLTAGSSTLAALGRYVADNDRGASTELGEFIEAHQEQLPPRKAPSRPARLTLCHAGQHHDLQDLFDRLNARYFGGAIEARIGWGRLPRKHGRPYRHHSLKLGSYSVEDRVIRIHPTLDHAYVPAYFVEWIVYHEMLHQKHPIPIVGGRRQFHTPAFLAEERLFDEYERAQLWERRNLHRLLVF